MKRLLFAVIASLGIHILLFLWEFDLTVARHRPEPEPSALNMVLISPAPEKLAVKPVEKPSKMMPKDPVVPRPKKKTAKTVQPVQQAPAVQEVERSFEESFALSENLPQALPPAETPEPVQSDPPERSGRETAASGNLSNFVREAVPMYRSNAPPAYPRLARKKGWQGTVMLEIFVDFEGRTQDIRIYESSGYGVLDEAAASAAKEWMFVPGMRGDSPVEMWVRVPVTFQLQ